jgi:hypothetical protein
MEAMKRWKRRWRLLHINGKCKKKLKENDIRNALKKNLVAASPEAKKIIFLSGKIRGRTNYHILQIRILPQ